MSNVLKILKINLLALVSFPLLLISIGSKLMLKALEKALVFLGIWAAFIGMGLLHLILANPSGFFEGIGTYIVIIFLFGIIIAIIILIILFFATIAAAVFKFIVNVLAEILGFIFQISHEGYAVLFDICKANYDQLVNESGQNFSGWTCFIWSLLKLFNSAIVKIFSIAFPISIAASVVFVGYSMFFIHNIVLNTFGIGVFKYLKLFPTLDRVFTELYFVILLLSSVIVILSLGIEWDEWGKLLKISTQNYQDYRNIMLEQTLELESGGLNISSFEDGKNAQICQQYMNKLNEMCSDFENLKQQVDTAMLMKYDSTVIYDLNEYSNLLNQIVTQMQAFKSDIPSNVFEKTFIPQIEKAYHLSKGIAKSTINTINKACSSGASTNTPLDFFEGCASEEDLKKRYRALCKVYHPDVGGHEETFKIMHNQYEVKTGAIPQ